MKRLIRCSKKPFLQVTPIICKHTNHQDHTSQLQTSARNPSRHHRPSHEPSQPDYYLPPSHPHSTLSLRSRSTIPLSIHHLLARPSTLPTSILSPTLYTNIPKPSTFHPPTHFTSTESRRMHHLLSSGVFNITERLFKKPSPSLSHGRLLLKHGFASESAVNIG